MIRRVFHLTIYILLLSGFTHCTNDNESRRVKELVKQLKEEYKDDYTHIPLDTADVTYISGKPFSEIRDNSIKNVYCGDCDNEHSLMIPIRFYYNLDLLTISFEGVCAKCGSTVSSGYSVHRRMDFVAKFIRKNK